MLNEFEKKVLNFCVFHGMLPDYKVLVALSGGGDSVALLHVMKKIGFDNGFLVEAAHMNHSLRGSESDGDEDFCVRTCKELKIPLRIERLRQGELYDASTSVETSARERRISFLEISAGKINADKIATGHNLDDQAETVLQRIIRGTGPSGISGILPVRGGIWIRPLLRAEREEIREYLRSGNIPFREDSSNKETVYTRNRIRHSLIPLIAESFNPNIGNVLARLAELSRIQEDFLEEKTGAALRGCLIHGDKFKILLDKKVFSGYHEFLKQNVIRLCLRSLEGEGRNTDFDEIIGIMRLIGNKRAESDITESIKLGVEKEIAAFSLTCENSGTVEVNLSGTTVIPFCGGKITAEKNTETVIVDGREKVAVVPELIERFGQLSVGYPMPGETIRPFGSKREVKIMDVLAEASLPKTIRKYIPVMRAGGIPVWVLGFRASEVVRFDLSDKKEKFYLNFTEGIINRRI